MLTPSRVHAGIRPRLTAVAAIVCGTIVPAAATAIPAIEATSRRSAPFAWSSTPPGVASAPIPSRLRVDGVPLSVVEVHSAQRVDAVLGRWRRWWTENSLAPVQSRVAGWHVLAFRRGAEFVTVQLRPAAGGGTEGYVALARPGTDPKMRPPTRSPIALPAGARVLRTLDSSDDGRTATQTMLATRSSAATTLAALANAAGAAGWVREPASSPPRDLARHGSNDTRALWFTRAGDELGLFVQRRGSGALALVHHVRARRTARELE